MSADVMLILGRIEGELKGIRGQVDKIDKIDERLRKVETKAALNGAVSGGVVGIGVSIIVASIREAMRHHGA